MALWHWVGGVVGAGVIVVAGGNLYADQQLKDFYQQQALSNTQYQIKLKQVDMGLFSGQAEYDVEFVLDPCEADQKFNFPVKDTITRGLMGYNIRSEIQFPKEWQSTIKEFFGDKAPFELHTNYSWTGKVTFKLSSPAVNYQKDQLHIQSKALSLEYHSNKKDLNLMKDVVFNAPSFIIRDEKNYFSLDQLKFTANNLHPKMLLPQSKTTMTINQMQLNTHVERPLEMNVQQMKFASQTVVKGEQYAMSNQIEVGKFKIPNSDQTGAMKLNFDFKNINVQKLQALYNLFEQASEQCMSSEQVADAMGTALLDLLEEGLKLESKNSVLQLGAANMMLNFDSELPKAQYDNVQSLMNRVPVILQYKGEVETSKAFVKQVLNMTSEQSVNDRAVDEMVNQLESQGMLRSDGDKITSKFEYKFGQPKFIN